MEKISYRITLDVHKGGNQKVLHGMFTGDVLSRKIVISLVAGSAVCNMDENTAAVMYVTKPSGVTNYGACTIEDNLVTYDVLPADIDEPGITQMQLKIVSGDMVLYAPMFSLEVQNNRTSDTPAETSPQFSALEQALAQAEEVYNKRIVSVEVEEDYTFVVTYADDTTYESDAFKAMMERIESEENKRVGAEAERESAEASRALAEKNREQSYSAMQKDIQGAIDANEALYNKVEELADEGLVTESRVIEIIEEQGGGGGGGTVVLPDNVLVASEVSAAEIPTPKVNADLFGSLPPSDYAKTADVENIKNGTTQVSNAKTLDGHGAEYFAPFEKLSNFTPTLYEVRSEAEYDELLTNLQNNAKDNEWYRCIINPKIMHSILGGSTYYVEGVRRIDGYGYQRLTSFTQGYGLACFERSIYGGTWGGWVKPLTTAGGTINGNVTKHADGNGEILDIIENGWRKVYQAIGSDGMYWLHDGTNDSPIIRSARDGNHVFNGTASGNLPLTGGTVGYLYVQGEAKNGYSHLFKNASATIDNGTNLTDVNANNQKATVEVSANANSIRFIGIDNVINELLHTGNKPSGSYIGNGETTRSIDVGRPLAESLLHVCCPDLGKHFIIGGYGGIVWDKNGAFNSFGVDVAEIYGASFLLNINNDTHNLNYSGYVYKYRWL